MSCWSAVRICQDSGLLVYVDFPEQPKHGEEHGYLAYQNSQVVPDSERGGEGKQWPTSRLIGNTCTDTWRSALWLPGFALQGSL